MDTVLFLILVYFIFNGIYKGFTGFVLKSFGLIIGLYLSIPIYKTLSSLLAKIFSAGVFILDFVSFLSVFIFIISTFWIFEKVIKRKLYKRKTLAITDRLLGGLMGGFVFLLLVIILLRLESENVFVSKLLSDSKIVQLFKRI